MKILEKYKRNRKKSVQALLLGIIIFFVTYLYDVLILGPERERIFIFMSQGPAFDQTIPSIGLLGYLPSMIIVISSLLFISIYQIRCSTAKKILKNK